MNNKTSIIIAVVVVLIVGIGAYFIKNKNVSDDSTSMSQSQNEDKFANTDTGNLNSNTNSMSQGDQTLESNDKTNMEDTKMQGDTNKDADKDSSGSMSATTPETGCVRTFSESKLKNDKIDINDKHVTLDIEGFGKIDLEFYPKDAPKTVENFLRLVNSGFYDCLTFHRVAKGFVIQGGDPNGNGTGGISAFGSKFEDELNASTPSYKAGYKKGVLAMANSGPNTNGSQFFIMLADTQLPHQYTIFGKVTAGLDIVDKIGAVDINPGPFGPTDGSPKSKVTIKKATIK